MTPWQGAGAGAAAAGGILGIVGSIKQAQAVKRAAKQAIAFENFKFREFFNDALFEQRAITEQNRQQYNASGVSIMHGSPLAVEVNVANEMARNIDRVRREMEMRKQQIRLDAEAGRASSIVSGISSGLNAASTITGILGRE